MMPSLLLLAAAASMDFRALTLLPVVLAMRSRVAPAPAPAPSSSAQVLRAVFHVLSFVLCYAALLLVDVLLLADPSHSTHASFFARFQSGSAAVWQAVPMFDLQVRELVPTIGTAWYMMMECFSDKRPVYLFILHFPPLALTLPIITRFWKQPHAALFSILALHSLWRPYPEVCRRSVPVNTVFRFISTSRTHPHSRVFLCSSLTRWPCLPRASSSSSTPTSSAFHSSPLPYTHSPAPSAASCGGSGWSQEAAMPTSCLGSGPSVSRPFFHRVRSQTLCALQLCHINGEFVSIPLLSQHTFPRCLRPFAHSFGRHTLLQTLLAHRRWLKNSKSKAGASAKKEHGD
jgi:hypothetical protein